MERPLIVFDVNETLLDLQHVTPILGRIFGDEGVMQLWAVRLGPVTLQLLATGSMRVVGTTLFGNGCRTTTSLPLASLAQAGLPWEPHAE